MTLFQGIVLATVQGLTEFLPISSTAHLVLVPWFFGWHDPGLTYDLVLHAGTLFALLAYFARTWWELLGIALRSGTHVLMSRPSQGAFIGGQRNSALLQVLVVATLPAAVAGYVLEVYAETVFRSPIVIAGMLVGVGLLMWVADRRPALTRRVETLGLRDALVIGMAQAVAIIPGTSRAGITIAAALFRNLTRESAAQFSFLLATPIIAGATISEGLEAWTSGLPAGLSGWDLLVGFVVSAVAGYAAITFLLRYLQVRTLSVFIAYRLTLGGVILLLELLRSSL
ncbi:MAG: undecaprenyl-diphosphate phosphatase, partial [Candidatus Methylomirabilales bacterium]